MIRLCGRGKIVRRIYTLLMKIYMHLGHPLVILRQPLPGFYLCLPGPVTVKVKIVMVGSAAGPWLPVFTGNILRIVLCTYHSAEPVYITLPSIWVKAWVYNYNRIFKPLFCLCIGRVYQSKKGKHCSFAGRCFVAMYIIAKPYNCRRSFCGRHFIFCQVSKAHIIQAYVFQVDCIFGRGNKAEVEGPVLIGFSILLQLYH